MAFAGEIMKCKIVVFGDRGKGNWGGLGLDDRPACGKGKRE